MAQERPTIGEIERLDPALDALVPADAKMEIIVDGLDWCEGPLWIPADGGFLIFSDIPPNTIYRWDAKSGKSDYLYPSGYTGTTPRGGEVGTNGSTLDREGRLDSLSARRSPCRANGCTARSAGAEVCDRRRRVTMASDSTARTTQPFIRVARSISPIRRMASTTSRRRLENPRQGAAVPGRISRDARRRGDATHQGARTAQRHRALTG